MFVKTNATPRPIVDSDHLSGLNGHNGLYAIAGRDVAGVGISKAALTKVYRHRIACIVVAYQESRQMQFFAMTS